MGAIFEQYPAAKWQVGDREPIYFPVVGIAEDGGNRLVRHSRPFREGAKLDDTGAKERSWKIGSVFGNDFQEPGVAEGRPLYPEVLRALLASFRIHECGTLTLPTVGDVRARAETYSRKESPDGDDYAEVELVFVEDNEEALDTVIFEPPAVVSSLNTLAQQTQFTAAKAAVWNEDLRSLREVCTEITTALQAPGRSVGDLVAVVRAHRRAVQGVLVTAEEESSPLSQPENSALVRQLRLMVDSEAGAELERTSSRPRTRPFMIDVERTSIFEVSARFNQDAEEVMDLNAARVDDPFDLRRGQVIRLFEVTP